MRPRRPDLGNSGTNGPVSKAVRDRLGQDADMSTQNAIGLILAVCGGTLELVGVAIVAVSVLRAFRWADDRVRVLRTTLAEYQQTMNGLADNDYAGQKAAEEARDASRRVAGLQPDTVHDDLMYLRTWMTHAIAASGRAGLWATVWLIGVGILLSAAGSVVSAFG
jgi:hypothetical protein